MAKHGKHLIWDFDGTLAYRPGQWSGALVQVLRRFAGRDVNIEVVRPFMQKGFPWHDPARQNSPMRAADEWWNSLLPIFEEAFVGCGVGPENAAALAHKVRPVYTDVAEWKLFEETHDVLQELREAGWTHTILSNHVPELPTLVEGLGLSPFIYRIVNSAETGYEKPHPEAFRTALAEFKEMDEVWMIGDNIHADVLGAESAGLRAILVRNHDQRAIRRAETLRGVKSLLGE